MAVTQVDNYQKFGALNTTSNSINALVVGPNGSVNPTLQVDASVVSAATGLVVQGQAEGNGVTLTVLSSGSAENLTIAPKGTGTITLTNLGATTVTGLLTANSGITITIPIAANVVGLTIVQSDTTNNPVALSVASTSTGHTVTITNTSAGVGRSLSISHGASGSGGDNAVSIIGTSSRSPSNSAHLIQIQESVTSALCAAMNFSDSNTNGTWPCINLTTVRTSGGIFITHNPASNSGIPAQLNNGTQTITGSVTDGYHGSLRITPTYSAATSQTVTRHNYLDFTNPTLSGVGPAVLTDAAVIRFNAAAGTHKALDAATTKTTPTGVDMWVKINANGTIAYVPAYLSKTA